ncbi:MAG: hypothetical protein K9H25_20630 [Rhodospirillum sp.]|nr:hypothetical protein [Rhodospirillum sp.]MCF8488694.1 hypothetical protein [Rhodospirillum sp.]MCF8501556.1 hypothetical protein [Rhodospirillum sp.]
MAQDPNGIMQLAGTVRVGGTSIDRNVLSSIHAASRKTGVSFAFMLAKARRESNFQTSASSGTSSAQGLYQFTTQTWLEQVKRHGADHGLADLANQIHRDGQGRYRVSNPEVAQEILDLREDHGVSSAMAAEYAADNRRVLTRSLGRQISDTDLYFAHFLGPGGAVEFLGAMDQDPGQDAAALLPKAALANHAIFFGAEGKGRSLGEIHTLVERTFNASMRRYASAGNLPELNGPIPLPPGTKPDFVALATTPIAEPETMGAVADRVASLPLPPGAKPTPKVEDMGIWRESGSQMASAEGLPRPLARKPAPETMGAPLPSPSLESLPRTLMAQAEAEGPTRWSDQALAISLAQASPSPTLDEPRARAFDALQAFARIAQSGYQWNQDETLEGTSSLDTLPSPGLPWQAEGSAPQSAPATLAGEAGADSLALQQTASITRAPKVTAASGAASYAVLAVVESFDPDKHLNSVTGPLPGLSGEVPRTSPQTQAAPDAQPGEMTLNGAPAPQAASDNPMTAPSSPQTPPMTTQAAIVGWVRRMFG